MNIIVFGLNHKTAPIEIREKFFLNPLQQDLLLSELKSDASVVEALVLSTCNRTEVYIHGIAPDPSTPPLNFCRQRGTGLEFILKLILDIKKIEFQPELKRYFYFYERRAALRHLLCVTAGLDSLILGEKQIIGQVKTAVDRARSKGMFGKYFNILSNIAIRTAKKAQGETQISLGGSSVSWAAMSMAEEILGTLEGKSILIIGAGKMGELALKQIRNKGVKNIYLMNRTGEAAQALAETCGVMAVSFMDIKEILTESDVCICAAGAPHYILDRKTMEKIMSLRHDRKLILIDISMPRNIDPQVASVHQVFLSHIDDLNKVVGENMVKRQASIFSVEKIIDRQLTIFYEKLKKLNDNSLADDFFESFTSS